MKAFKFLTLVAKIAGIVAAFEVVPLVDPATGAAIFAVASILKDSANRLAELFRPR
jgi:hypothetical protein